MQYRQESEDVRADRAINLIEWALMLLKAGFIAEIAGFIMLVSHHAKAGALLIAMFFVLFGTASGLGKRAGEIYPEGEEPKW